MISRYSIMERWIRDGGRMGLHTPPSDEAMKYDIRITKEMGFNMIRKHIKVEPDRWYYWCDKMGILVWQDMPSGMVVLPGAENKRPDHLQHISPKQEDLNCRTEQAAQFEWELRSEWLICIITPPA